MRLNFKFYKNPFYVAFVGVMIALMWIIGWTAESLIPSQLFGTYVNFSPAEAILFVAVLLAGIAPAFTIGILYWILILATKPSATNYIGEFALLAALMAFTCGVIFGNFVSRPFWKKGHVVRGMITATVAMIFVAAVMTFLNIIVIIPSYLEGLKITFIWNHSWMDISDSIGMAFRPSPVGFGILHGNAIKYAICGYVGVAMLANPAIWQFKNKIDRMENNKMK